MDEFHVTHHAAARILDMGVDPQLVRECLLRPERIKHQKNYPGRRSFHYGDIFCVVDGENNVVTVLWNSNELWERDITAYGEYNGRTLPNSG